LKNSLGSHRIIETLKALVFIYNGAKSIENSASSDRAKHLATD